MKLYDIKQEYEDILESATDPDTGEVDEEKLKALSKVEDDLYQKIDNCCGLIRNRKAEAEALREEAKRLMARAKTAENSIEGIKNYMLYSLQGEKVKTSKFTVSFKHTKAVEVTDLNLIPEEYLKFKDPEPNKQMIKEAIENGEIIDGARLVENVCTMIR